nr:hypothetical protein GCM10020093_089320 [Planobispora longispora]
MIHANAPFEMFDDCVFRLDRQWRTLTGAATFAEFVNRHCTHLVFTMANTLKIGSDDPAPFIRLQSLLDQIDKPVVIFGLGVQSDTDDLTGATLPAEAISVMRRLQDRCAVIGVRGRTTQRVLEQVCGVTNVKVAAPPCSPARRTWPGSARASKRATAGRRSAAPSSTSRWRPGCSATPSGTTRSWSSPRTGATTSSTSTSAAAAPAQAPRFLRDDGEHGPKLARDRIEDYYQRRYRLFRDTKSWYRFNEESVSFTYGTRFHVNMASILSGKPPCG